MSSVKWIKLDSGMEVRARSIKERKLDYPNILKLFGGNASYTIVGKENVAAAMAALNGEEPEIVALSLDLRRSAEMVLDYAHLASDEYFRKWNVLPSNHVWNALRDALDATPNPVPPMGADRERKEFEEYAGKKTYPLVHNDDGEYGNASTRSIWSAWQAAWAAAKREAQ